MRNILNNKLYYIIIGFLVLCIIALSPGYIAWLDETTHTATPVAETPIAFSQVPSIVTQGITTIPSDTPTPMKEPIPSPIPTSQGPATYVVAMNGDNTANGSENSPWKTVQHAVDKVKPGDTILLRAGEYSEAVHIVKSGLHEKPIYLKAFPGESVAIDGGEAAAIKADASYWVIDSLTLHSSADRTLSLHTTNFQINNNVIYGAIYIWGSYNTISNNEIDGSRHAGNENGIMDDGPSSHNNQILNNKIHDFYSRGIWSQWFTHDNLIEGNTVYNITGETGICIDLDAASNVDYRHTIRGNVVHDCGQTGIELENSYDTLVENNLVYNTGLEAIQVISYLGCKVGGEEHQYGDSDGDCRGDFLNSTVRQNIIYNGGRVGGIVSYESAGVFVYQNLILATESTALYFNSGLEYSSNWDVQGNIFIGSGRAEISVVDPKSIVNEQFNILNPIDYTKAYEVRDSINQFYSLPGWQQVYGSGYTNFVTDPYLVNPAAGDFRLNAGSPAINAGPNLAIERDFAGNPRVVDGRMDIGPYEWSPNQ
jgi:parallel beta-helix repeat protein